MKLTIKIAVLFILVALFNSCKKEEMIEPTEDKKWESSNDPRHHNMIQIGSEVIRNKIHSFSLRSKNLYISDLDSITNEWDVDAHFAANYMYFDFSRMPGINQDFIVGMNSRHDHVLIQYFDGFSNAYVAPVIPMQVIDTNFREFDFNFDKGYFKLNNLNRCLVPYKFWNNDIPGYEIRLYAFDIILDHNDWDVDTANGTIIKSLVEWGGLGETTVLGEDFLLSFGNQLVRMDSDFILHPVYDNYIKKIVEKDGILYGFGISEIIRSIDNGITWENIGYSQNDFTRFHFENINNEIIAYYDHQLVHFIPEEGSIKWQELDNTGLEKHEINSLLYFKGKAVVTTSCEILTKDFEDLLTPLEE